MKLFMTGCATIALLLVACDRQNDQAADAGSSSNSSRSSEASAATAQDWTQVVSPTSEGGFVMGNPDAPVKLVEYASMTCSHCADFSREASQEIRNELVKTGQVSFEIRNFPLNGIDVAVSLLTRCQGADRFFRLTEEAFAQQEQWMQPFNDVPDADAERLLSLPPERQVVALADAGDLYSFFEKRGLPRSTAQACLENRAAAERLAEVAEQASKRGIEGTPTFMINGQIVDGAVTWAQLEPRLRQALRV